MKNKFSMALLVLVIFILYVSNVSCRKKKDREKRKMIYFPLPKKTRYKIAIGDSVTPPTKEPDRKETLNTEKKRTVEKETEREKKTTFTNDGKKDKRKSSAESSEKRRPSEKQKESAKEQTSSKEAGKKVRTEKSGEKAKKITQESKEGKKQKAENENKSKEMTRERKNVPKQSKSSKSKEITKSQAKNSDEKKHKFIFSKPKKSKNENAKESKKLSEDPSLSKESPKGAEKEESKHKPKKRKQLEYKKIKGQEEKENQSEGSGEQLQRSTKKAASGEKEMESKGRFPKETKSKEDEQPTEASGYTFSSGAKPQKSTRESSNEVIKSTESPDENGQKKKSAEESESSGAFDMESGSGRDSDRAVKKDRKYWEPQLVYSKDEDVSEEQSGSGKEPEESKEQFQSEKSNSPETNESPGTHNSKSQKDLPKKERKFWEPQFVDSQTEDVYADDSGSGKTAQNQPNSEEVSGSTKKRPRESNSGSKEKEEVSSKEKEWPQETKEQFDSEKQKPIGSKEKANQEMTKPTEHEEESGSDEEKSTDGEGGSGSEENLTTDQGSRKESRRPYVKEQFNSVQKSSQSNEEKEFSGSGSDPILNSGNESINVKEKAPGKRQKLTMPEFQKRDEPIGNRPLNSKEVKERNISKPQPSREAFSSGQFVPRTGESADISDEKSNFQKIYHSSKNSEVKKKPPKGTSLRDSFSSGRFIPRSDGPTKNPMDRESSPNEQNSSLKRPRSRVDFSFGQFSPRDESEEGTKGKKKIQKSPHSRDNFSSGQFLPRDVSGENPKETNSRNGPHSRVDFNSGKFAPREESREKSNRERKSQKSSENAGKSVEKNGPDSRLDFSSGKFEPRDESGSAEKLKEKDDSRRDFSSGQFSPREGCGEQVEKRKGKAHTELRHNEFERRNQPLQKNAREKPNFHIPDSEHSKKNKQSLETPSSRDSFSSGQFTPRNRKSSEQLNFLPQAPKTPPSFFGTSTEKRGIRSTMSSEGEKININPDKEKETNSRERNYLQQSRPTSEIGLEKEIPIREFNPKHDEPTKRPSVTKDPNYSEGTKFGTKSRETGTLTLSSSPKRILRPRGKRVILKDVTDVRLIGHTDREGRVEVKLNNDTWLGVCGQNWGIPEGMVVCRQLGLGFVGMSASGTPFGCSRSFGLTKVHCDSTEKSLSECLGTFQSKCRSSQDDGFKDPPFAEATKLNGGGTNPKPILLSINIPHGKLDIGIEARFGEDAKKRKGGSGSNDTAEQMEGYEQYSEDFYYYEIGKRVKTDGNGKSVPHQRKKRATSSSNEIGDKPDRKSKINEQKKMDERFKEMSCQQAIVQCRKQSPDLKLSMNSIKHSLGLSRDFLADLECDLQEKCLDKKALKLAEENSGDWNCMETDKCREDSKFSRKLLTFEAELENQGTADFLLADRNDNMDWNECTRSFQTREAMFLYELVSSDQKTVVKKRSQSFCLQDMKCENDLKKRFRCAKESDNQQGLSPGCLINYKKRTSCQYLDITEVEPGDYWFRISVNSDLSIPEETFSNNKVSCRLNLSRAKKVSVSECKYGVPKLVEINQEEEKRRQESGQNRINKNRKERESNSGDSREEQGSGEESGDGSGSGIQ